MTARDPVEKEIAREKKEVRLTQAELDKQAAREHNAATRVEKNAGFGSHTGYTTTGTETATYSTTGVTGHTTGAHQMSALPGHGTGQPTGQVVEGAVGSHPVGINTGTGPTTAAHNTRVEGTGGAQGYGTGGYYS